MTEILRRVLLPALLLLALVSLPLQGQAQTSAAERTWRVQKWSGAVEVLDASGAVLGSPDGAQVGPGFTVRTGPNGRVQLVRGSDTILLAERSSVQVPLEERPGLSTTIRQTAGSATFDVETKAVRHFQVETPHLAALVKGTNFQVIVEQDASRLEVSRGLVEVSDLRSGQIALVDPGHVAASMPKSPYGLSLSGPLPLPLLRQGTARVQAAQAPAPEQAAQPIPLPAPAPPEARSSSARGWQSLPFGERMQALPRRLIAPRPGEQVTGEDFNDLFILGLAAFILTGLLLTGVVAIIRSYQDERRVNRKGGPKDPRAGR